MTESMEKSIVETYRRRAIQDAYNQEHGIIPTTIKKDIRDGIVIPGEVIEEQKEVVDFSNINKMNKLEKKKLIEKLEKEMYQKAKELNFEEAMALRNIIFELKA
jgi:excinuclease ABC subunit B